MSDRHYCVRCGNCCRVAGASHLGKVNGLDKQGTQACIYFMEPDICKIYEKRPTVCRTEDLIDDYVKQGIVRNRDHYYEIHERTCRRISRIKNINLHLFIKIVTSEINK